MPARTEAEGNSFILILSDTLALFIIYYDCLIQEEDTKIETDTKPLIGGKKLNCLGQKHIRKGSRGSCEPDC